VTRNEVAIPVPARAGMTSRNVWYDRSIVQCRRTMARLGARLATSVTTAAVATVVAARAASLPPSDIVNGTPTTDYPAVGALLDADGELFCTAFLIGPSCVLTAAHCVEPAPGAGTTVFFGSNVSEAYDFRINVLQFLIHPLYDEMDIPAHDVAVVALVSATDIVPLERASPGGNNTTVRIVGFGYDALNVDGIKRTATVQQTAQNATSITTDGTVSNICGGDSGSPLLRDIDGTLFAIGVASAGDQQCASVALWERLSSDTEFVDTAAAELCTATTVGSGIFFDGFESGDTSAWSVVEPNP
jgi:V8-like Glu-specific endopeptidase